MKGMTMENLIGRFAVSNAGHDAGTAYLIVGQEGERLLLCDGKYKTLIKPKRKNRRHVRISTGAAEEPMLSKLFKSEKIFNHEIKYAIKRYLTSQKV